MADHLRPPRPGDPIEARPLRRFVERVNALAKLRVTGSVGPERMDAKLSGTGGPYTCTEQAGTASGGWADRAGGRVVPCYELNAQAGLAGKVVPAWRDQAGVWRFEYARTGVAYIGPPSTPCSPCDIPQVTLNLTWQYANTSAGTTTVATTLAYNATTGQWRSPNLTRTDYPTGSGLDPCWTAGNTAIHWFTLYCASSGFIQLDHNCHCNFGSDVAVGAVASPGTGKVFSCSPFSLDWTLSPGADADRRYIVTT